MDTIARRQGLPRGTLVASPLIQLILLSSVLLLALSLPSTLAQPTEVALEAFLPTPAAAAAVEPAAGVSAASSGVSAKDRMRLLLLEAGVIPDVIASAPTSVVKLNWPGTVKAHEVGLTLTPTQVHERPRLNYVVHANRFYTVAIVDPDAPTRKEPIFGQWMHWLGQRGCGRVGRLLVVRACGWSASR